MLRLRAFEAFGYSALGRLGECVTVVHSKVPRATWKETSNPAGHTPAGGPNPVVRRGRLLRGLFRSRVSDSRGNGVALLGAFLGCSFFRRHFALLGRIIHSFVQATSHTRVCAESPEMAKENRLGQGNGRMSAPLNLECPLGRRMRRHS